ncbi:MAG TPA: hypothetical protein VKS79_26435 [Gemmataceae bacterium]|nr:hypothetical protein [Gemmataceae bacterium]
MERQHSKPEDLVLTEADPVPPPDMTVPDAHSPQPDSGTGQFDPNMLLEVKRLAHRVGGIENLRNLIEALIRFEK